MAIPELNGKHFYIPEYQRGYRWQKRQIMQLLSDLNEFRMKEPNDSFYCLQPVVVKLCDAKTIADNKLDPSVEWYEVIDGQQRLTTIRLIMAFDQLCRKLDKLADPFTIYYKTRKELGHIFTMFKGHYDEQGYLNDITLDMPEDKVDIDAYHVYQAIKNILKWFTEPCQPYEKRLKISQYSKLISLFQEDKDTGEHSIQIIWYELLDGTDPRKMFNRLNNDKIALTNSELIRAIFLSDSAEFEFEAENNYDKNEQEKARRLDKQRKQAHIVEMWDMIEHKLREENKEFWSFLTNRDRGLYSNCIELIFDFISEKYIPGNTDKDNTEKLLKDDELYTFLYFDMQLRSNKKKTWELWLEIEKYFAILCHWYEDYDLYHKIGFLVYKEGLDKRDILPVLAKEASSMSKKKFIKESIDKRIASTIKCDFDTINYTDNPGTIQTILTLYNVELHRNSKSLGRFPFNLFKENEWTIEHIHAQNSEGINNSKRSAWESWIEENIRMLDKFKAAFTENDKNKADKAEELIRQLKDRLHDPELNYKKVETLFNTVLDYFDGMNADRDEPGDMHKLSNLTLLNGSLNTSLSNMVFEGKRQRIIEADATGCYGYIPIGTKRVFLKYHNHDEKDFDVQQLYFWGKRDRHNYEKEILTTLEPYIRLNNSQEPETDNV